MISRTRLFCISLLATQLHCAASEPSKSHDKKLVALIKEIHEKDGIFSYDRSITQTGYLTRQTDTSNAQTDNAQNKSSTKAAAKTTAP